MLICRECHKPVEVYNEERYHSNYFDEGRCPTTQDRRAVLSPYEVLDVSWAPALWYSECCRAIIHEHECTACGKHPPVEQAYCPDCHSKMLYHPEGDDTPAYLSCTDCGGVGYDLDGTPFLGAEVNNEHFLSQVSG